MSGFTCFAKFKRVSYLILYDRRMQNDSNGKNNKSIATALLVSLLLTALVGLFVFMNTGALLALGDGDRSIIYVGTLLILCFVNIYWITSGGYFRLRDKMVLAMPGKSWGEKARFLAFALMSLGVLAAFVVRVLSGPAR